MDFSGNKDKKTHSDNEGRLFDLSPARNKAVTVNFMGSDISFDGGLLLFKECKERIGIVEASKTFTGSRLERL